MCPSCPTPLMAVRQQEKHGVVSRGVLESACVTWGHTICLAACQGVSGLQPSHICHENKIPPQHKTAAPQCMRSLLSRTVSLHESDIGLRPCPRGSWVLYWSAAYRENSLNYFNSTAQIPGWPCPAPARALAARNRLLIMHCGSQAIELTSNQWQQRGNISKGERI